MKSIPSLQPFFKIVPVRLSGLALRRAIWTKANLIPGGLINLSRSVIALWLILLWVGIGVRHSVAANATASQGAAVELSMGAKGVDQGTALRPRVVIMSDFPPIDVIPGGAGYGVPEKRSDPDDVQSMVRFLLYANDLEVEGLVASAATMANVADKQGLLDLLALYDRADESLRHHDARYPTADHLRSVTWAGRSATYGRPAGEILGPNLDSEASDAIITAVDRPDPRPIWICAWGGPRELAQALWKVQNTRTPAETAQFARKIRVFLISLQDGTGQWMLDKFPNLFVIHSARNFQGMFFNAPGSDPRWADFEWLNRHVRKGHGMLGAFYPECGWNPKHLGVIEGDSPSFLHLVSGVRGLNNPEQPDQPGWGGRFVRLDPARNHWTDDPSGPENVWRWREYIQKDFAQRMDWCAADHPK